MRSVPINYFKILSILFFSFLLSSAPNWDCDDDGVLDNFNDFQNNGSITLSVSMEGTDPGSCDNWIWNNPDSLSQGGYCDSDPHDLFAVFVGDELRGVGALNQVPFGPNQGDYQFLALIY